MKSEKALQNYLFDLAEAHGIFCRKVAAVGHVGFPDVMLARYGRIVLVELKSPDGKGRLSKKQEREIERLMGAGVNVYVVNTPEGVENVIKQIADA